MREGDLHSARSRQPRNLMTLKRSSAATTVRQRWARKSLRTLAKVIPRRVKEPKLVRDFSAGFGEPIGCGDDIKISRVVYIKVIWPVKISFGSEGSLNRRSLVGSARSRTDSLIRY